MLISVDRRKLCLFFRYDSRDKSAAEKRQELQREDLSTADKGGRSTQKDEEQEKKFDGDAVDDWVICYAISKITSGLHFEMKLMARGSKSCSFDFLFISFSILIKKFSSRLAGVCGASRYKSQMEMSPKNLLIVFGAQSLKLPFRSKIRERSNSPTSIEWAPSRAFTASPSFSVIVSLSDDEVERMQTTEGNFSVSSNP